MDYLSKYLKYKKKYLKLTNQIGGRCETSINPYINATTKSCPNCNCQITHYHGHGCHHIKPGAGCPYCGIHWCYKCRSTEAQNIALRNNSTSCLCGGWSNFCEPITNPVQIVRDPIPHDNRCGCVFCPDCRQGHPCSGCDGNCVVCIGIVTHGPTSLDTIDQFGILNINIASSNKLMIDDDDDEPPAFLEDLDNWNGNNIL
jgi:hypothetical protein